MDRFNEKMSVSKIAVLNLYLQGGHLETAEMESTERFIRTANNRGIDVRICKNSDEIEDYQPDFVFSISYQVAKLTKYPTYLSVNIPVSMIKDYPRFIRNILSYDGFVTLSPNIVDWLSILCRQQDKKLHIAPGYFTIPKTTFRVADFKNATAMYMGTNWDGLRHNQVFSLLSSGEYLKCYGPKKSWAHYPATLYNGEIPFDGVSSIETYFKHGAGLCIGHPIFDDETIANNRMFEIAAASALPICSDNDLTKQFYGDTVLYIERKLPTQEVVNQITAAVKWIRSNPKLAEEMAFEAHRIFNDTLSMEYLLDRLLDMHHNVLEENAYHCADIGKKGGTVLSTQDVESKVAYILPVDRLDYRLMPILKSLASQTHQPTMIFILSQQEKTITEKFVRDELKISELNIEFIHYRDSRDNGNFFDKINMNTYQWIGVITALDKLFPNHIALLLEQLKTVKQKNIDTIAAVYAANLEYSDVIALPDKMFDEHTIRDDNRMRIGYFELNENAPLCAFLWKGKLFTSNFFSDKNFYQLDAKTCIQYFESLGEIISLKEITCATNLDSLLLKKPNALENSGLLKKVYELNQLIDEQQKLIEMYQASKSWRYMAPMREFFDILRRIKYRFRAIYAN